jgi:polysaccharide export outer membrane protein
VIAGSLLTLACGGSGSFVWYSDLPPQQLVNQQPEYVIEVGDLVNVRVYEQDGLTTRAKIRSDGRIALPLIGELTVAGKHPSALAREIEARLKEFIVTPRVTINIEESQPVTIDVLGEIAHPGPLTLQSPSELLQAIAQAGGLSDYADKSGIFVLQRFPQFRRIRFTYQAIVRNEGGAATFPLRTGDVLVVE